jgi:hypothetical protein
VPDVPRPTTLPSPRSRGILLFGCAATALLLSALWLLSQFRGCALLHTGAAVARNSQTPDGQMGAWECTLTTWSLQTYPHQLRLVRGEYLSIMSAESEKDRFAGQLGFEAHSFAASAIRPDRRPWFVSEPGNWRFLGFGAGESTGGGQTAQTYDVPYWLLMVIFGTPALLAARRHHALAVRAREGRCLKCGYQLDAHMTICPECGTARTA